MDQQMKIAKQMMDQQRLVFDSIISNMITFWDQYEKVVGSFVDQAVWVPPAGKTAIREMIGNSKKSCETFKSAASESFNWFENFLNGRLKPNR